MQEVDQSIQAQSARDTPVEAGMVFQLADGSIAACNRAAERLLGFTSEQIRGWTSTDSPWQAIHEDGTAFPGDTHPAIVALQTGQPQLNVVMGLYHPDGSLTWIEIDAQPLFQAPNSMPYGVVTTFRQIEPPLQRFSFRQGSVPVQIKVDAARSPEISRTVTESVEREAECQETETAMHESEKTVRQRLTEIEAIYATAPVGLCFVDHQLRFVRINQRLAGINGVPVADHLGRTLRDILPEQADDLEPLYHQVLETGVPLENLEIHGTNAAQPNVKRAWLLSLYPLEDGLGQVLGVNVMVQEITDRKQAESALREAQIQLESALVAGLIYTWRWNLQEDLVRADSNFAHLFGVDPQVAAAGLPSEDFINAIHPDDRDHVRAAIERALLMGEYRVEYRVRNAAGQERWVSVRGRVEYDATGKAIALPGALIDITDRKQVEATLQQSEDRLRLALESTQLGVWDNDLTTNTATWDERCKQLWGLSQDAEVSLDVFFSAIHPDDREATRAAVARSFNPESNGAYSSKYRVIGIETGIERWIAANGQTYFDAKGQPTRFTGTVLDITDAKRREAERQRAQTELRDRQERLQAALVAAGTGTFRWDIRTSALNWDENLDRLFGLQPGQTVQNLDAFIERVHPDDRQGVIDHCARCVNEGADFDMDFRVVYPDGSIHWLSDKGKTFFDENGAPAYMTGACVDISDRKQAEREIRRFASLADNSSEFIGMCDLNLVPIYINAAGRQMVGLDESSPAHETPVPDFYFPEDQDFVAQDLFPRVLREGQAKVEIRLRHFKTGEAIWMLYNLFQLKDENNQSIGFATVSHNITERKEVDLRLELAQQVGNAGFFDWRVNENKVWVTGLLRQIAPADPQTGQMKFSDWAAMVHPEDAQRVKTLVETTFVDRQKQLHYDFRVCTPTGERWLSAQAEVEYDAAGQPHRVLGINVDITDRKQIEAELRQTNAILNVINESTPSPIYVKDRAGKIIFANPATLNVLGKPASEVIGYRDDEIYPGLGETVVENDQRIMETGKPESIEESPDGIRTFLSIKVPYRDETGAVIGLVGVSSDITDRVQVERDRVLILQREQAARAESERANRIKDEFLAVLSHELRSPLNPILGWTKLLQSRRLSPEKTAEALAVIDRNAKLQSQLIEDLLDVSRILRGKLILNPAPVDLATTIAAALETVRLAAEAKNIQIELSIAEVRPMIGDSSRLQQVLWNLLTNAVKFTPENGQVKICLTQEISHAQIQVIDTGKGINPDFLPYVFEHFRQEDGAITRSFGGLGLGLAIVRQIVELHGGTVEAKSLGEDQGATFTVRLPLPKQPIFSPNADIASAEIAESVPLIGIRVLVVDDEADSRDFVAFALEQEGASVVKTSSAIEALQILEQSQFDILISDIGMPEVDGYTLMRQVRTKSIAAGGQIPAIALTAYAGELDQQQAISVGFQHHLAKPVDLNQLTTAVLTLVSL